MKNFCENKKKYFDTKRYTPELYNYLYNELVITGNIVPYSACKGQILGGNISDYEFIYDFKNNYSFITTESADPETTNYFIL